MLNQLLFGNTLQAWLIFLGTVVGATIFGWLVARVLRWIANRSKNRVISAIIQQFALPLTIGFILLGLQLGISMLEINPSTSSFFNRALLFIFALLVSWGILRIYEVVHQLVLIPFAQKTDSDADDHLFHVVHLIMRVLISVLGIIVGLSNAGFDVGAVLAGLGLGGLAFALAAQDTVANLFGGVTVLLEKPFKIGDQIEINGIQGFVQEIGLRTTLIESRFGRMIRIPNKFFTEHAIETITHTRTRVRVMNKLILRYDTPSEKIQQTLRLIKAIVEGHEHSIFLSLGFTGFGEYGFCLELEYDIVYWSPEQQDTVGNARQKMDWVKTTLNLAILQALEANGVKLALPVAEEIGIRLEQKGGIVF